MPQKKNVLKTTNDLTAKQRKFVDVLVANWGSNQVPRFYTNATYFN